MHSFVQRSATTHVHYMKKSLAQSELKLKALGSAHDAVDRFSAGLSTATLSTIASLDQLTVSVDGLKAEAQERLDFDQQTMTESIFQVGQAQEYLALIQSHLSLFPGMTRDLRTIVEGLPHRDEALTSSLAVDRLIEALAPLPSRSEELNVQAPEQAESNALWQQQKAEMVVGT